MQVPPGLVAPACPSTPAADESFVVQQLRSRLAAAEKDMSIICAGAAIALSLLYQPAISTCSDPED